MGAKIPRHRMRLFYKLGERWNIPPYVLKGAYLAGKAHAEKIHPLLDPPAKKLSEYHKQGYKILMLGRDTLPLRFILTRKYGVPTRTLGISSVTKEVYGYHLWAGRGLAEAVKVFKKRYPKHYNRLKEALEKLVGDAKRVVVVDVNYAGTHAYLVSHILREMGIDAKPFLVFGVGTFPAEIYYKGMPIDKQFDLVREVETEDIKPHAPYHSINRAKTFAQIRSFEERIKTAGGFAGWLGWVDWVIETWKKRSKQ